MKDRALLVGINDYPPPFSSLEGCVNDVVDMANFLVEFCNFRTRDIRLVTDRRATRKAIVQRLYWLVGDLQAGDRILFHFSGHGAQVANRNEESDEVDGLDEIICPADFDWTPDRYVADDLFSKIFSSVPDGVEFVWISDSCHSGDLSRGCSRARRIDAPADLRWREKSGYLPYRRIGDSSTKATLVSACQSNQTASDASFDGRANGAFTYCLLNALRYPPSLRIPLAEVVPKIHAQLENRGFSQNPRIEGAEFGMKAPFMARFTPNTI